MFLKYRLDVEKLWRSVTKALEVLNSVARIIALALDLDIDFFDRLGMLGKPIATSHYYTMKEKRPIPHKESTE